MKTHTEQWYTSRMQADDFVKAMEEAGLGPDVRADVWARASRHTHERCDENIRQGYQSLYHAPSMNEIR